VIITGTAVALGMCWATMLDGPLHWHGPLLPSTTVPAVIIAAIPTLIVLTDCSIGTRLTCTQHVGHEVRGHGRWG
jgi:hypothetical protein